MTGGGIDTQEERWIPLHWTCGGDVEGSGGDFKSPVHGLHHLPQLPSWVSGRLRHRYRHPLGQDASEVICLEGGGRVHDLSGTAQGA